MAVSSTAVDCTSFSTDAKFRTWGSAISAAIVASGLTVTTDTGQINWTTVTKPTATVTKAGYEVYKFNDTLQSTKPIFFRIDYGSSTVASGNGPNTWLTVGTGSDGAGNITGTALGLAVTASPLSTSSSAPDVASVSVGASYSTGAGACLILCGFPVSGQATLSCGFWALSRTSDTSGNPTSSGLAIFIKPSGSSALVCVSYDVSTAYAARNVGSASLSTAASISGGTTIQLYRNYAIAPTPIPILGALSYYTTDVSTGAIFGAAPFGSTSHNYRAFGTTQAGGHDTSANSNMCGAYIWE